MDSAKATFNAKAMFARSDVTFLRKLADAVGYPADYKMRSIANAIEEVLLDGKRCPAKAEFCIDLTCAEHPKAESNRE